METDEYFERQRFREEYGALYNEVLEILRRHDPIGVDTRVRPGEYVPEAGTILPRLRQVGSLEETHRIVHDEVVRWRGAELAGPAEKYFALASDLWTARKRHDL